MKKQLRVLHTPFVIAGNASCLAEGERAIGLDSKLYYFERNIFSQVNASDTYVPPKNFIFDSIRKIFFTINALVHFDVIHYNYGSTIFSPKKIIFPNDSAFKKIAKVIYNVSLGLLHNLDLKTFSFFNKKIFMTFQGSDSRLAGYHVKNFEYSHCKVLGYGNREELIDAGKVKLISSYSKYVTHFFAVNPDLLHTLPKNASFLPYSNVNIRDWTFTNKNHFSVRPRFIHAPSNLDVKGTKYIVEAVDKLKQEGFNFDFNLVHGVNHEEMKDYISKSDILIDQLLAGWYGGVAVEAMALGRPVICYIRDEDKKFLPKELVANLPIIEASPKTIYDVMKNVLSMNAEAFAKKQLQSRKFVEDWHDPQQVAKVTESFYIGSRP